MNNRKIILLSIMGIVVLSFGLIGCQSQKQVDKTTTEGLTLTIEELKAFNGENGQPAYVAVDGIIYDVSAIGKWKNGVHQGKYHAGNDLSNEINNSPHGKGVLDQAVIVGQMAK